MNYKIHCLAKDCIHNIKDQETCTVIHTENSWIDISKDGKCVDYTVLTQEELDKINN